MEDLKTVALQTGRSIISFSREDYQGTHGIKVVRFAAGGVERIEDCKLWMRGGAATETILTGAAAVALAVGADFELQRLETSPVSRWRNAVTGIVRDNRRLATIADQLIVDRGVLPAHREDEAA